MAIAVFVVVTAAAWGVDWISAREGVRRPEVLLLDDALTGAVSAVLVAVLMRRAHEKELELKRRLKVQSEMNHHIRNALQPILYAATIEPNEYTPMVRDSIQRIEWALREVLQEPSGNGDYSAKIDKIHSPEK